MKLTLEGMREIAKRLPVGYYLGRKVPVTIEPEGGAYCDVVKGEIYIGMPILQIAADHIDATDAAKWDREKTLRCLLYHEVGHLLLTPKWLGEGYVSVRKPDGDYDPDGKALLNIFEDERLEQVLSHFFIGVDFKGFARLVNKGKEGKSSKRTMRFLDAVRLRLTTPKISKMVDDAIQATSTISNGTSPFDFIPRHSECCFQTYRDKLNKLVIAILGGESKSEDGDGDGKGRSGDSPSDKSRDSSEDGETDKDGPGSEDRKPGDGAKDESEVDAPDDTPDATPKGGTPMDGEDSGGDDADEDKSGSPGSGEENSKSSPKGHDKTEDADASGDMPDADASDSEPSGKPEGQKPRDLKVPGDLLKSVASKLFYEPTSEVSRTLNRFASRLSKRKGAQAAGCWSGLHGRIDTRRDATDKDRIFRRKSDVGDKLMSSVNLVLWVDVSGSFSKSKDALNRILSATARTVELSGGHLHVEVVKMGDCATIAKQSDWTVDPCGGNSINRTYYESWKKTRRKNWRNIDIVVFDGDAKSDESVRSEKMPDGKSIESVIWNSPDCHIISDRSNIKYFSCLRNAHVTYVDGGYAERLEKEVVKTLDRIL